MTTLAVVDNSNGKLTLSGTAITDAGNGRVALAAGPGVIANGNGTLTLTVDTGPLLSGPVHAKLAPRRATAQLGGQ